MTAPGIADNRIRATDDGEPRRRLARIGAILTVLVGLWLGLGHMALGYPLTTVTRDTVYRDEGIAILVILLGYYLCLRPGNAVASFLCVALGVVLVASGLWLPHEIEQSRMNEIITGIFLTAVALLAGTGRSRRPR